MSPPSSHVLLSDPIGSPIGTASLADQDSSGQAPRVSDVIPRFLDHLRVEERRAPGTLLRYRTYLSAFRDAVKDCPMGEIDSERLSIYKRRLMDQGLSAATMATMLSSVRSLLRYVRSVEGWTTYDPERVRRPKIPLREVEYLTKEEVQRFLAAIPLKTLTGLRDRALAEILCATGMRISEALSLNRADIDWETKEAQIVGKGNKERRVYFTDTALQWLAKYLAYRHDDNPALLIAQGFEPQRLRAEGIWRQFRKYGVRAGIGKSVYPHMLRHTMATTLLANGCPIGHIRTLLGHGHLQTTCRYYLGIISAAEAKAAHARYLAYDGDDGKRAENRAHDLTRGPEH